jgi:hypothetical protein
MQGDFPPFSIDSPPENIVKVSLRDTKVQRAEKHEKRKRKSTLMSITMFLLPSLSNLFDEKCIRTHCELFSNQLYELACMPPTFRPLSASHEGK